MILPFKKVIKNRFPGFCVSFLLLILFHAHLLADQDQPLPPPVFSRTSGFYAGPFGLVLSTSVPGANIYYTLDGSEPDPANLNGTTFRYKNIWPQRPGDPTGAFLYDSYKTEVYTSFITIPDNPNTPDRLARKASSYHNPPYYLPDVPVDKATVVRAITARAGFTPSPVVTHTYFMHNRSRFSLPIITISSSEEHLFDYDMGIYTPGATFDRWRENNPHSGAGGHSGANYKLRGEEWEYPAHIAFWDSGSSVSALSQNIGIRMHGGYSRAHPMKSIRLYARSRYGESTLDYPFFPEQDGGEFKRLVLRNSGNDHQNSMFRDALIQRVCRELNFETQDYRPVVVFLNGEYWGIHNIRERYDKHYIKRVFGVEEEDLDLLTHRNGAKEGDNRHYNETISYIEENGLQDEVHYQYIKTRIDTENFIDYQIANIYSANTDWPGNNIDFWRKRTEYQSHTPYGHDGRWRWMAFDMDFGFGIWGKSPNENVMEFATMAGGTNWPNPDWSTFLLRSFLENESFTTEFVNRFAGLLNTSFRPERVNYLINKFYETLKPEFPKHIARWKRPHSMSSWENEVNAMRNFATNRTGYQWGHLMDYFDLDTVSVTLGVSSPGEGFIRVNDIDITASTPGVGENPWPWRGTYFSGVPVTFEAVPLEGYRFSHWEGTAAGAPVFTADPSEAAIITAHFEPAEIKDIIHLWHFNDLPGDDSLQVVAADYSAHLSGELMYPGAGAGYMDRVDDSTEINLQDGTEFLYSLRVRNPSEGRELVFSVPSAGFENLELSFATRRTPNGAWNQTVYASSNAGESWIQAKETYVVSESWQPVSVDLSGLAGLNDNPAMQIKILFGGETASGESGNNRFDNITLTGEFLYEHSSYYNKPGSNLNEPASWGSEPDGTGQAPGSFDTPGAVYHIRNGDEATIAGNWAVSGILSGVMLGDGSDPVMFTVPTGYSFAGKIDVKEKATLVLQNTAVPSLGSVSPLSTVVFEQEDMVIVPARDWGSLHLKGGMKVFSGHYLVAGSFTAEDTKLSFAGASSLTLQGDLSYLGNVQTHDPENVNILATGPGDQVLTADAGNRVDAYNFYIEKTTGSFTAGTNINAENNLRLEISGSALFRDGGHTLQLGDDLRIRGDESNFDLSGTILLKAGSGTNDMEISGVPLHNLVVDAGGNARVDFNDAAPVIVINNDLTIISRSSRPVRLRDKQFIIRGNLLLDVEEPEQTEQGESFIVFNGDNLQTLENTGYGGPGLLQSMVVNGGGLQLEGSVTIDSLIRFENGVVATEPGSILKLGPGGIISQASPDSYVMGPMGIYSNSTEPAVMEFAVGKDNGLRKVLLEAAHQNDNLRLYTVEYFNQAPPQNEPGTGVSGILENQGWYNLETDREGEITGASISLSYAGETYPADSITIATEKEGEWVSIGSEPLPGQQGMIRSTIDFQKGGIFTLALKKDSPVSVPVAERVFTVYPNPVPENGTVSLPEIMDVTLVSSSGVIVLSGKNVLTLSLEGIPPGIYILKNRQGWHARIIIAGR